MPKKSKTNNQSVTSKEFNETKKEFIERFDKIDKRFEQVDKRFEQVDKRFEQVDKRFDEVKDIMSNMAIKIIDNIEDLKTLKETVATKDDIRQIMTAIDSFGSQTKDHERTAEINTHRIKELEPKVENHEKRIGKLESHNLPSQ